MLLILLLSFVSTEGSHFNGGTITWAPTDPYDNSSTVNITITQSYSWIYPNVSCTTNVPITTSAYSGSDTNLTCVSNCDTDGGYSMEPIDILTDCTSASTPLGMMLSERSVSVTLNASAYFYLAYTGSTWRALNNPPVNGLGWSILTLINLQMRDDGILNTPPAANVISPQYVIVNTTTQINILVSDANVGDDIRCRWSVYHPGYRRRRDIDEDSFMNSINLYEADPYLSIGRDIVQIREKRQGCSSCNSGTCSFGCSCGCSGCSGTTCSGSTCSIWPSCLYLTTTTTSTTSTTSKTTTTTSTTTTNTLSTTTETTTTTDTTTTTTTTDTTTTTSYLHPPIDECGGICYPSALPNDTTLSNCTVSFNGLVANTWYAVAIQVEDFINDTSTVPMSSVPVQFLIYVLPTPSCSLLSVILPLTSCLQVQTGVTTNFTLYAMNLCGSGVTITDIIVSKAISGMIAGNLTNSATNSSLVYVTYTWTPQVNQVGLQKFCAIAYNNLSVQSTQYCVTFTVTSSTPNCSVTTFAPTTTITPAKTSSNVDVSMVVGLSFLGLLLSIAFSACFIYYFCRNARTRRRRQNQSAQQEKSSLLDPFNIFRKNASKKPVKRNAVENRDDNMNINYVTQSSMSTEVSYLKSLMPSIANNNTNMLNNIDRSFPVMPNQTRKDIDFSSDKTGRLLRSISLLSETHSIELSPIQQQLSKYDNDSNPHSANASRINTPSTNPVQPDVNAAATTDPKTKVIKVKVNEFKESRRSEPINTKPDKHNASKEKPQGKSSPNPIKSKQIHTKISKLPRYEKPEETTSTSSGAPVLDILRAKIKYSVMPDAMVMRTIFEVIDSPLKFNFNYKNTLLPRDTICLELLLLASSLVCNQTYVFDTEGSQSADELLQAWQDNCVAAAQIVHIDLTYDLLQEFIVENNLQDPNGTVLFNTYCKMVDFFYAKYPPHSKNSITISSSQVEAAMYSTQIILLKFFNLFDLFINRATPIKEIPWFLSSSNSYSNPAIVELPATQTSTLSETQIDVPALDKCQMILLYPTYPKLKHQYATVEPLILKLINIQLLMKIENDLRSGRNLCNLYIKTLPESITLHTVSSFVMNNQDQIKMPWGSYKAKCEKLYYHLQQLLCLQKFGKS
ncbi:unnamed protein product [Rotaria magnacalcarata]